MQWNTLKSHIRHISVEDQERIRKAFELGKHAHEGQTRKSGEPYFTHPIAVARMLADLHADADSLIAALLHDTVEDTNLTLTEIDTLFDGDVSSLIDGVTKLAPEDFAEHPSLDEQIETLRKMFTLLQKDVRVMVIKLVDRLHNMQTIEHLPPDRQKALAKETLDVYVKIADRLSMQDLRDEMEGLCSAVLEPDVHVMLQKQLERNEQKRVKAIADIRSVFTKQEQTTDVKTKILTERKSWRKLQLQLNAGDNVATGISTVTAVFVCKEQNDCYEVLGALHAHWPRETLSFQDFINAPMINGYRGLHTTIILTDGTRVRCKIRTEEMHTYARMGVATLCFDSEATGVLDYLLPWTERISHLSHDTEKKSQEFWENLKSDILGESIVMHGPNDEQILLPQDATALDGALYLYGKKGLRVKEILIDGVPAKLSEKIPNASSLSANFAMNTQASLEWLDCVKTGIATALIREELSKAPDLIKQKTGRDLLGKAVAHIAHIGLAEMHTDEMLMKLGKNFELKSLEETYRQIAEGKLTPDQAATALFPQKKDEQRAKRMQTWILKVRYPLHLSKQISPIIQSRLSDIFHFKKRDTVAFVKVRYHLTRHEMEMMSTQLSTLLPESDWSFRNVRRDFLLTTSIITLVTLWGLDPVFARLLLQTGITPVDLTLIRFLTFFAIATVFYLLYTQLSSTKFKPIHPFKPSLIASGIALFVTAAFSYLTLTELSATGYIIFIIGALVFGSVAADIRRRKATIYNCISLLLLLAAGVMTFTAEHATPKILAYASLSAIGFFVYSLASNRYQREVEQIQARYPAYLFWLAVIILPLAFALVPLTHIHELSPSAIASSVLFVTVFSIVPYGIYFECMRRMDVHALIKPLPLVCIGTLLGDLLIHRSYGVLSAAPFLIMSVILFSSQYYWKNKTPVFFHLPKYP